MKRALILDEGPEQFVLEYDDTRGGKYQMRLEAVTYEKAIQEAREFLGIASDDRDEAGDQWSIE